MDKRNFAFDRMNFILLAVGMAVVIIGFLLMGGPGLDRHHIRGGYFQHPSREGGSRSMPYRFCFNDIRHCAQT